MSLLKKWNAVDLEKETNVPTEEFECEESYSESEKLFTVEKGEKYANKSERNI